MNHASLSPARCAAYLASLLALTLGSVAYGQPTIVLYQNDFETPNQPIVRNCGFALDSTPINTLFGTPQGTFQQTFTVEAVVINDPSNTYTDPLGIGGNYAIGMLSGAQDDRLGLTFDMQGRQFLNVGLDISSIDVSGCGGPFGIANPTYRITLYDSPGGVNALGSGAVLADTMITGIQGPDQWTFNWTNHVVALDGSGATDGSVRIEWDLLQSGYAAFDNLAIAASNRPGDVGNTCSDPATQPSYAGGYVLNAAGTRAFVAVEAPEGATSVRFYNTNNLNVGAPETDTESMTAIAGVTRSGDTFSFTTDPTVLYFPITTAGGGTGVSFFLEVTDTCPRTVDVDPVFAVTGVRGDGLGGFALLDAAPSPTAGRATLRFSLAEASEVTLAVYDVLGREVARLIDGAMPAGTHEAPFDGSRLPSGLYVYRLTAGGQSLQRTVTIGSPGSPEPLPVYPDLSTAMNSHTQEPPARARRTYEAPRLTREALMPLVTAGSFDLFIPNAP